MENLKGKTGLKIVGLVLLGYLFAYQGSYTALLLLFGFAILVEKNETLNFQLGQVLVLRVLYTAVLAAWAIIYRLLGDLHEIFEFNRDFWHSVRDFNDTFADITWYAFVILLVMGLIKVIKCSEAKIPIVAGLTKKLID